MARTSSAPSAGTVAIVSPVAGFSTGIRPSSSPAPGGRPRPLGRPSAGLPRPAAASSSTTNSSCGPAGSAIGPSVPPRAPPGPHGSARMRAVRTIVISDLHLGSAGDADLLRRPEMRTRLWQELEGVNRVVLLGDMLELRDRPLADVIDLARPFFAELADAARDASLLVVPGNHDHHLLAAWLERRQLADSEPLALEHRLPADNGPVRALL